MFEASYVGKIMISHDLKSLFINKLRFEQIIVSWFGDKEKPDKCFSFKVLPSVSEEGKAVEIAVAETLCTGGPRLMTTIAN